MVERRRGRRDGRRPGDLRPVRIVPGFMPPAEGSVLIEFGDTRVICTASVQESVPPFLRGSGKGWVTAEYAMLPRSSPERIERERRGPGGRTHEIQRLFGRSLRAVTDMDALGERSILVDCDVIQADGGTRTASITGGYVALALAIRALQQKKTIARNPLARTVAAVSVGIVGGEVCVDLDYGEDSTAEVDMNVVATGDGALVEVQGTAEGKPFARSDLDRMVDAALEAISRLKERQEQALRG